MIEKLIYTVHVFIVKPQLVYYLAVLLRNCKIVLTIAFYRHVRTLHLKGYFYQTILVRKCQSVKVSVFLPHFLTLIICNMYDFRSNPRADVQR